MTFTPCTLPRSARVSSAAIVSPSIAAASTVDARRTRSRTSTGTRTPGTSFARYSASSTLSNGRTVSTDRKARRNEPPMNPLEGTNVKHRSGDHVLCASIDFPFEATNLLFQILRPRVDRDADVEHRRAADRLAADIEASIQARHCIDQTDGVNVQHCGGIGVITNRAHLTRHRQAGCAYPTRGRPAVPTARPSKGLSRDENCSTTSMPACCRIRTASDSALSRGPLTPSGT